MGKCMEGTETQYDLFFYCSPEQTVCAAARPRRRVEYKIDTKNSTAVHSDTACLSYTLLRIHTTSILARSSPKQ
eukprot:COSAG05_NODE_958_length_6426_cov_7.214003_5_plen_74_part_00